MDKCMFDFLLKKKNKEGLSKKRIKCLKKFLYYFPKGFADNTYLAWERNYKWEAHEAWQKSLNKQEYERLLDGREYSEIALRAVRLETKTNLLFSFEKMALRDAVKPAAGAKAFATGLHDYVYGKDRLQQRFERFTQVLESLPRKQTRVSTWPVVTVFGFIAQPKTHIFLKPNAMRAATRLYGGDFAYQPRPSWESYRSFLGLAGAVRRDLQDLRPRDMMDLQSFLWVIGSDEYAR